MSAWDAKTKGTPVLGRVTLRLASESPVPYASSLVTLVVTRGSFAAEPVAYQATTLREKREAVETLRAHPASTTILAIWKGRTRADAFLLDTAALATASRALGIDTRTPAEKRQDEAITHGAKEAKRLVDAWVAEGFTRQEALDLLGRMMEKAAR